MKKIVHKINVSRAVCDHLVGEHHTQRHRMITGVIIVVAGVAISKIPTSIHTLHWMFDAIGYGVHGLGCVPFIERFISLAKSDKKEGE